jgi:hypothetical protein
MKAFGMIGMLAALAAGYYLYSVQTARMTGGQRPQVEQIDLTRVRTDLLSFAQAERYYLAANGNYGTIEQLQDSSAMANLPRGSRRGYTYTAEIDGAKHFVITATPEAATAGLPVISVDETLTIRQ